MLLTYKPNLSLCLEREGWEDPKFQKVKCQRCKAQTSVYISKFGSLKKINKTNKPLAGLTKRKREKIQSTKISNEIETLLPLTGKNGCRRNKEQPHTNKLDNLDERDIFLKRYKPPRLTQEERENQDGTITSKEIQLVIKKIKTFHKEKPRIQPHW